MHSAYNSYARCLGDLYIDTGERERSFTLYCRWIGRSSKEGETGEGHRKHTKQAFGRIKKCLSGKTCYVFFCNMLRLLSKPVTSFVERRYVFFWKILILFWKMLHLLIYTKNSCYFFFAKCFVIAPIERYKYKSRKADRWIKDLIVHLKYQEAHLTKRISNN